jgi:hypothetical protein
MVLLALGEKNIMNINAAFSSQFLRAVDIGTATPTVTIKSVDIEELGQGKDKKSLPVVRFEGKDAGLVLNKTNASIIAAALGEETDDWVGRKITLRVEDVPFKGDIVAAIRVSIPQQDERKPDSVDLDNPKQVEDEDVPF